LKDFAGELKDLLLLYRGAQASTFVERVNIYLVHVYIEADATAQNNCSLVFLLNIETLDEWVEFETLHGGEKQVTVKLKDH
jgi:hypothetical protein